MSETTTEQRLAAAMASFGRDVAATDEGWEDVVSGRTGLPTEDQRIRSQRYVVGIAAAVLVVGLVVAGATLGRAGRDPSRTTDPAAPPTTTTEVPTSTTLAVDPNASIRECLDGLGVEYRIEPSDGDGLAFGPPASATDEQDQAFTDGIEECHDRLWPEPSAEERAQDLAYGEVYVDALRSCFDEAGVEVELVPQGEGAYDIRSPGSDRTSPELQAALGPCSLEAEEAERAARAEAGDG